jgi:hypothetical protein
MSLLALIVPQTLTYLSSNVSAVDNHEVIHESNQLTNACAWCPVRKNRKTWPINNAWENYHVFLCCLMAKY